jgi:LuxR family transcriptional regulator, maltose regulon positive regulatory protein
MSLPTEHSARIEALLASQQYAEAALLIDQQAEHWMRQGQVAVIRATISQLPQTIIEQSLGLSMWLAWVATLIGESAEAEYWVDRSQLLLDHSFPQAAALPIPKRYDYQQAAGQLLAIRAFIALRQNKRPAAIELAEQALTLLPGHNQTLLMVVQFVRSIAQLEQGQLFDALPSLQQARRTAYATAQPLIVISLLMYESLDLIDQGKLQSAYQICQRALAYAEAEPNQALQQLPHLHLARITYLWNDLAQTQQHLASGLTPPQPEYPLATIDGYLLQARLYAASNQWDQAHDTLQAAKHYAYTVGRHSAIPQIMLWEAACFCSAGRTSLAADLLKQSGEWAVPCDTSEPNQRMIEPWLVYCRLRLNLQHTAHYQQTEQIIAMLLHHTPEQYRLRHNTILLLRIHLQLLRGQHQPARKTFAELLTFVASSQAERLILDEAAWIGALLHIYRQPGPLQPIAERLQHSISQLPAAPSHAIPLLSHQEQTILDLLALGYSNAEIAQHKQLALSTIQWHLKQIYHKLNVHSRTQAIHRAHQLNLLSSASPQF